MNTAITTLRKRIELLNKEYEQSEKTMENPDEVEDYFFAMNDMINISNECVELQHAIRILEHHTGITKE